MRGGARPGAGRKRGSRNKRSAETVARAKAAGMLPHEFLCTVSQGRAIDGHAPSFSERLDAAKAAAPFYAPKLTAIEAQVSGEVVQRVVSAEPMSEEEWLVRYGNMA